MLGGGGYRRNCVVAASSSEGLLTERIVLKKSASEICRQYSFAMRRDSASMIQGSGADGIIIAQNRPQSAQAGLFQHNLSVKRPLSRLQRCCLAHIFPRNISAFAICYVIKTRPVSELRRNARTPAFGADALQVQRHLSQTKHFSSD
jgi:hypothetical protein